MKLICPSCLAKLDIDDYKIPSTGAWAKCPKCSEKFFIRKSGQNEFLKKDLNVENKTPIYNKDPEAEKLLKRLKKDDDQSSDGHQTAEDIAQTIIVYPALSQSNFSTVIAIAILLISLSFIIWKAMDEADNVQITPAIVSGVKIEENIEFVYDLEQVVSDTNSIHAQISHNYLRPYKVEGNNYQILYLEYFLKLLSPKWCQKIETAYIEPYSDYSGFEVTIICKNKQQIAPKFYYKWVNDKLIVNVQNNFAKAEINLKGIPQLKIEGDVNTLPIAVSQEVISKEYLKSLNNSSDDEIKDSDPLDYDESSDNYDYIDENQIIEERPAPNPDSIEQEFIFENEEDYQNYLNSLK